MSLQRHSVSPSKYCSIAQLAAIRQGDYLGASGQDYTPEDTDRLYYAKLEAKIAKIDFYDAPKRKRLPAKRKGCTRIFMNTLTKPQITRIVNRIKKANSRLAVMGLMMLQIEFDQMSFENRYLVASTCLKRGVSIAEYPKLTSTIPPIFKHKQ